jgi:hypothetical protein
VGHIIKETNNCLLLIRYVILLVSEFRLCDVCFGGWLWSSGLWRTVVLQAAIEVSEKLIISVSETMATVHKTTVHHNPEDNNQHFHRCQILKLYILGLYV